MSRPNAPHLRTANPGTRHPYEVPRPVATLCRRLATGTTNPADFPIELSGIKLKLTPSGNEISYAGVFDRCETANSQRVILLGQLMARSLDKPIACQLTVNVAYHGIAYILVTS